MADISMCNNHRCPLSSTCYRYLAKPSLYQSYFIMSEEEKQITPEEEKEMEESTSMLKLFILNYRQ